MEIKEFIENFAEQFDDIELSDIQPNTRYKELEEWSSITAMSLIAMAKTQYGKTITGLEVRSCTTVEELFNLIASK